MSFFIETDANDERIERNITIHPERYSGYRKYPDDIPHTPENAGVYIFFDSQKRIQYIGKAHGKALQAEIKAQSGVNDMNTKYFRWFLTANDTNASSLESDWNAKYQLSHNTSEAQL